MVEGVVIGHDGLPIPRNLDKFWKARHRGMANRSRGVRPISKSSSFLRLACKFTTGEWWVCKIGCEVWDLKHCGLCQKPWEIKPAPVLKVVDKRCVTVKSNTFQASSYIIHYNTKTEKRRICTCRQLCSQGKDKCIYILTSRVNHPKIRCHYAGIGVSDANIRNPSALFIDSFTISSNSNKTLGDGNEERR